MPSDHIDCPFCSKKVSRINFGAHLLSKEHVQQFYDANTSIFTSAYNNIVVRKDDPEKLLCLKAGNEQVRICLGCKRCYAYVAVRKEATTHFEDHPECCEKVRAALTTLCGPKEVVMPDPDALQRENDALKREIERLKKQPIITTPVPIVMTESGITQEMYDEEKTAREEAEADSDRVRSQMMAFRVAWKELLPGAFAGSMDIPIEIKEIQDFLARRKETAPEPPKPKFTEAKVAAYVAAHISRDWEGQGKIGITLNNVDLEEASRRIMEHEKKPKPQVRFEPPPEPKVLTSTLMRGKQTDRERAAQRTI